MWTQAWCAGAAGEAGEAGMHMHHAWAAEQAARALVAIAQASCHADSDRPEPGPDTAAGLEDGGGEGVDAVNAGTKDSLGGARSWREAIVHAVRPDPPPAQAKQVVRSEPPTPHSTGCTRRPVCALHVQG